MFFYVDYCPSYFYRYFDNLDPGGRKWQDKILKLTGVKASGRLSVLNGGIHFEASKLCYCR